MVYETDRRRRDAPAPSGTVTLLAQGLLVAALGCSAAGAQTVFQVHEVSLQAARPAANPLATPPRVTITGPGGRTVRTEMFWDGGLSWKFRFMPEAAGQYRWSVESADASLRGRRGSFSATPPAEPRHSLAKLGPPRISRDRRHFEHPDGTPWFWLADTAWNGALMSTAQEWDDYLAERARQRFTAVQVVLTQWRAGLADADGRTAFSMDNGTLKVDPRFFQRMDERMNAIGRHGLVAVPVMLWALTGPDKESPGESLADADCILLASYLRARYGAHPVLWFLGGDGDYREAKAEKWRTIGRAVFPPELARRPVTLHPRGSQDPWPPLKDEPWLDYLVYQSGHSVAPAKWRWLTEKGMATGWQLTPVRPVLDSEPNYEGHTSYNTSTRITDFHVRRSVWTGLLAAPIAGVTYGAHGIWPWMREAGVPLNHKGSGVADPWRDCLRYPGGTHMTVVYNILERLEWTTLRPARDLVEAPPPDAQFSNYVAAARSTNGRFALVYSPIEQELLLDLSGFRILVNATWIDPRTGARHPAGRLPARAATPLAVPPGGDWLLLLEN